MDAEKLLKREKITREIFARLNNFVDLKNTLSSIIQDLKTVTGFEAVSVRLNEDNDYPYYVYNGFPDSFIKKENFLCSMVDGKKVIGKGQKPRLNCFCGNVIRGMVDQNKPYYTSKGSYWSNSTTKDTDAFFKNEAENRIRNYCSASGYESVGLFPIKTREENIGLIQINDKRRDMFTPEIIDFMEMIGEQIGVAIENAVLYEKLKEKNAELQNTLDELNHAQTHLLEAKKMSALADMVTGIAHEIYHPITDSLQNLDKLLNKVKNLSDDNNNRNTEVEDLIQEGKHIHHSISEVKGMVKSFRTVAFDQFQESRHLINLKSFIEDVFKVMKPTLRHKKIDFTVDCNAEAEIMSFSGVLSQIITILIKNSHDHGFAYKTEGKVNISCALNYDDFIEIRFSDNGNGIDKKVEHKIFEPFFTTDRKNHTGLGLYIAQNLAASKLKGNIVYDNTVSSTDFILRIPV